MRGFSWTISRYLLHTILPYFIFSWLLLSVIVFFQQAGRFSEIFFSTSVPKNLVWQLAAALIPNVIAFTCPMAVLVGVTIGLSKTQGDSELKAIRAAGIGNFQLILPIFALGVLLSGFAFFVNQRGVPFAAQLVRAVSLQAAVSKLESPIEPGVFNTEVKGYTIYVKEGDVENGVWKNVFIYQENISTSEARLITSRSGWIDTKNDSSELVLDSATVNTFPIGKKLSKFVSENVGQVRFAVKTGRDELADKINNSDKTLDELGMNDLAKYASDKEGREKTEAELLLQRRIILSITPLIFSLLGAALVLRLRRGGRGIGVFLALISLVLYYLIALLGEQLARTNYISVFTASLLPVVSSLLVICCLLLPRKFSFGKYFEAIGSRFDFKPPKDSHTVSKGNFYIDLTTGILDFDIVSNLLRYFLLTLGFLTSVFLIFTAFELWKFAGIIQDGVNLLLKYLFYLLPYIYIQVAPSALMIAALATFIIKSRQNEVVTWTAAGQSVYRLLLPCFVLVFLIGALNFGIQEKVLPKSNQIQESVRAQIRGSGVLFKKEGKLWTASDSRIYSFEIVGQIFKETQKVKNLTIYEFGEDKLQLKTIYKAPEAVWAEGKIKLANSAEQYILEDGKVKIINISERELSEEANPFNSRNKKPNQLSIQETREQIESSQSEIERRSYEIALEKKYTTLFLPFVITLFTAPFALSLSRKGKVATVGYAIGVWLLFMGITGAFEQFGLNGFVSAKIAIWSPLLLFSMLGAFLLTKIRT